eukprot:4757825-Prorocentrum_lima.AAC.1
MKNSQIALHYVALSYCLLVLSQVHPATRMVTASCLTLYLRSSQHSHDHYLLQRFATLSKQHKQE